MTVLEVGCGRGDIAPFPWRFYPGVRLVGLDPDLGAAANPHLSEFIHLNGSSWQVPDVSVDLVICRYVLEHVAEREEFFANLCRVTKKGGRFIFLTPNLRHPAILASSVLPVSWKRRTLRLTMGVAEDDIFPTHYRMNSERTLRSLANRWGFGVERLTTREFEPCTYLDRSSLGFVAFYTYFQLMSVGALGRRFGASILGEFRKL
jgi:ubiquinone/menaquinone biosynthesis C-methylase UbiE